jgi:hypothetical protein
MIVALYATAGAMIAGASLYLAWWYTDARKFLAGAFFMSSVILFYHWLADVRVPLLGTDAVLSPEINGLRAGVQFILFLVCGYYGFIHKPTGRRPARVARAAAVRPPQPAPTVKAAQGRRKRRPASP